MATETEQLVVSLEARINQFEKAFQRASATSNDNWTRIEQRASAGSRRLEQSFVNAGRAAEKMTALMSASKVDPLAAMTRSLAQNSAAIGLNRNQQMELMHVARSLADEIAASGLSFRAFAMEGGRISEVLGSGKGGVSGTLAALGGIIGRFAPALIGLGAAFTVFETAKKSIEQLSDIVEKSSAAGMSAPAFQAWIDQAGKFKISAEEAEKAIQHAGGVLEKQLNPVIQNQEGDLAKRSNKLSDLMGGGVASKDMVENAKSVEQLHQAALQLVQDYLKASEELHNQGLELQSIQQRLEAARAATEVWGEAGKKIAEGIESGAVNVENFAERSKEVGRVWSNEIFEAQKKVGEELQHANEHLSEEMKPSLESIAKLTLGIMHNWANIVDLIAGGAAKANEFMHGAQSLRDAAAAKQETHGVPFREAFAKELAPKEQPQPVDAPLPPARPANLGEKKPREHVAKRDEVENLVRSLERENAALKGEVDGIGKSNEERQKSIDLQRAEEAALERKKPLTDAERASVEQLAEAHAKLRDAIDKAAKNDQEFKSAISTFGNDLRTSFADAIVNGEKLSNVLDKLVKQLANQLFSKAFDGIFSAATSGLTPGVFKGLGFADGGFVSGPGGPRSDSVPAMLSAGEFVVSADAAKRYAGLLHAINSGQTPHFAAGGIVGAPANVAAPSFNVASGATHIAPTINTTVNASGGTPEQNADLAKRTSAAVEASLRQIVLSELLVQRRPGNLLWNQYAR